MSSHVEMRFDPRKYRQPLHVILFGNLDPVSRRSFLAAGLLGVAILIGLAFAPAKLEVEAPSLAAMPERFARLILEAPEPAATPTPTASQTPPEFAEATPPAEVAAPVPEPKPVKARPERRTERKPAPLPQDRGDKGREQAQQEITSNLRNVTSSIDRTLGEIAQALPTATSESPRAAPSRRRRLRRGRGGEQLAKVSGEESLASVTETAPALLAAGLSIETPGGLLGGGSGEAGAHRQGEPEIRSNASLLSVLRHYAPGVRYCYDNELKRSPGLEGKLVLRIAVSAEGRTLDVKVLEDSLGSKAVRECVLAQVADWRFPAIAAGEVTFKAPFVFTAAD